MTNKSAFPLAILLTFITLLGILLPATSWLYSQWQMAQRPSGGFPVMTLYLIDISDIHVLGIPIGGPILIAVYVIIMCLLLGVSVLFWIKALVRKAT